MALALGQIWHDLTLQVRLNSATLGMRAPMVVLPDALSSRSASPGAVGAPAGGDTIAVSGTIIGGRRLIAEVESEPRARAELALDPFLLWAAVMPMGPFPPRISQTLTMLWIALLVSPLAYWAGRATRDVRARSTFSIRPLRSRVFVFVALTLILGLAVVPPLFGFPVARASIWLAAAVDAFVLFLLGAGLSRASQARRSTSPERIPAATSCICTANSTCDGSHRRSDFQQIHCEVRQRERNAHHSRTENSQRDPAQGTEHRRHRTGKNGEEEHEAQTRPRSRQIRARLAHPPATEVPLGTLMMNARHDSVVQLSVFAAEMLVAPPQLLGHLQTASELVVLVGIGDAWPMMSVIPRRLACEVGRRPESSESAKTPPLLTDSNSFLEMQRGAGALAANERRPRRDETPFDERSVEIPNVHLEILSP
jgi:hypothetical protein